MSQGLLPFQFEEDPRPSGVTGLAGLPLYLDLAHAIGFRDRIGDWLKTRTRGWKDAQLLMSAVLLHLAGGDRVEDLDILEKDGGFVRLLMRVEETGLTRRERRERARRWRKDKERGVPSPPAMLRFLKAFHDPQQERRRKRSKKKAFVPAPNKHLKALAKINAHLVAEAQRKDEAEIATLDMDATLIRTKKEQARHCYEGYKAYQPMNVWWAQQEMMLYTEFRDGNVGADSGLLRVFKEAVKHLPAGVRKLRFRSDAAGYVHELLRYLNQKRKRYGVVDFAVGCDVTDGFKAAAKAMPEESWKPIRRLTACGLEVTCQEHTEVLYAPKGMGQSKKDPVYRYIAIREPMREQGLPGLEEQQKLPFQTIRLQQRRYKLFGVVTNIKDPLDPENHGQGWDGEQVIKWYRKRCGRSEQAHSVLKSDLAGGTMPCKRFGANAAWWWFSVIAMNLNALLKRFCLGGIWVDRRLIALRYGIVMLPGIVIEHARRLIVRVARGHPFFELLLEARARIAQWKPVPAG